MTSRDALDQALTSINDPNSDGRVTFTKTYEGEALLAAEAADRRAKEGRSLGPLDGAIISIKDLFDVAGEATTAGSKILKGAAPARADAPIVAGLKAAGAVIVGKTNMTEFAFSGIGVNPHFGTPGNGRNKRHVPGGSSSGAGVSVVEGTCRIAIGTDTGGSTRIPAAFNGCVGFKPTAYRISRQGAYPLSTTLDSVGPLAKTVVDCALADSIMAGEAPWVPQPISLKNLKLAVPQGLMLAELEGDVEKSFSRALNVLQKAGVLLHDDTGIDPLIARNMQAQRSAALVGIEAYAHHRTMLDTRGHDYDQRVRQRLMLAAPALAADYIAMLNTRAELCAQMDVLLSAYDAVVLPTTAIVAPKITDMLDDNAFFAANFKALRNTSVANQFDLCAISLPCPVGKYDLPVGLMLFGRNGHDKRLFEIAAAVEARFNA